MFDASKGILYIKKRSVPEWLTFYIIVCPFFLSFFLEFLGAPSAIKYTIDIVWVAVLISLFFQKRVFLNRNFAPFVLLISVWLMYVLTVYLLNYQSPFYFLWGLRNNFRFYVAFIAFAILFEEEDGEFLLRFIDKLFWVNAIVSFVQYFALGYEQDYLGGIFGVEKGCNSYSIIFFGLVISKSVLSFLNREEGTFSCFAKCATALLISAFAELKFFFLVFIMIMVLAFFLTKVSWRKIILVCVAAVLMIFAGTILAEVFGESNALTFERIWELITATNYATAEDLGRFTAIPTISESILTSLPDKLFGMGLGNCDTSAIAICNTPFYMAHMDMHYTWFSSAFLFLETGYIGLILNISFFVISLVWVIRRLREGSGNLLFNQIGVVFSILCIILTFYNSSLRMEVGYVAYFALALPVLSAKATR